ncbi:ImmA/IrrE family metallo-endopeptidase [Actinomadura madurae]|uniref:ImmA/IrrE family metallo-endopeptidase n=1 Tax=Actinomadura madurae TaxID=1993 RepID=UPI00399ABA6E
MGPPPQHRGCSCGPAYRHPKAPRAHRRTRRAFSAASFHLPGDRVVIVCNPLNDPARTNSDIAHEIAHILLRHEVRELQTLGGNVFFTCDPDQEEEANWLAGCLLLPRQILLREAFANAPADHIAAKYQVST